MTRPDDLPGWIEPMAATLTQERFVGAEWTFERKFDGIRLIAYKHGSEVRLYARTQKPRSIPVLETLIAKLSANDLVLDGELTWDPGTGGYHVFDILRLNGRSLMPLPLMERRAILDSFPFEAPMHHVVPLTSAEPWTEACAEGWEGVIAKRLDSAYEQRRSKAWLKMKCELTQHFVVGGFTDPQGARVGLGALLVGYFEGDDFVFAGKVGTGFDTTLLVNLRARLDATAVDKSPFTRATGLPRVRAHWVRPEIVVSVSFIEWTVHLKLRHSRLLGLVPDANPHGVVRAT